MKQQTYTIILFICFAILVVVLSFFGDRKEKKEFLDFNNAEINGQLTGITLGKGTTIIEINRVRYFTFVPSFTDNKPDFRYFAKKGDSVYKAAKSDTLTLIHNGKVVLYTFKTF